MKDLKIEINSDCIRFIGCNTRYSIHIYNSPCSGYSMLMTYLNDINGNKNFVCLTSDSKGSFL